MPIYLPKNHLESLELAVLCFLHNGLLPFPTVHRIEGLQSVLGSQVFKYFKGKFQDFLTSPLTKKL